MNFSWRTKCNMCKRDKSDCESKRSPRSRSRDRNHRLSPAKGNSPTKQSLSPKRDKTLLKRKDSMEELFSSRSSSQRRRDRQHQSRKEKSLSRSLSPVTKTTKIPQDDDYYKRFGDTIQ
jgi:hypothetical protein